jgi:class I lanthipeptide synthase
VTVTEEGPYYRPTGPAMLRASVHSSRLNLPPWPAEPAGADAWRSWLTAAWNLPRVADTTACASPHLADQIAGLPASRSPDVRQARRAAMALARYLLRMRGRATPFGEFAGITVAPFGARTTHRWSDDHTTRARPDAAWLADITVQLEACMPLLARLPVTVNDLATVNAGRLTVPWQPHQSALPGDPMDEREVSVRLVAVVATIRDTAVSPVRVCDLVDQVAAAHPGTSRQALHSVVGQLVAAGVLITSLRAPSTTTDVLAHLRAQLDAVAAHDLADVKPLLAALEEAHQKPDAVQRLTVDLRLGGTFLLPHTVADEAAAAAQALARLSSDQAGPGASWRTYHRDFLARYGPGALVSVEELTDTVRGLGFPAHFSQLPTAGRVITDRDETLLALAQQAALDGVRELVLDDTVLNRLTRPARARPVTPADLWADIRSASTQALDSGEFTLGVCGFGRAGATTGRFLDLLDDENRQTALGMWAAQPPAVNGALRAHLSFPPRRTRTENVLRVPPVVHHVIPLAEHRTFDDRHILLADLAVAADTARLYVISRSRRRVVEPVLPHAGARHTMPPLARLLFEIPRATHPPVTSFDWGAASCLPFLPRVRYGRSILAPATWRVDPAAFPGHDATETEWAVALDAARGARHLPAHVAAGPGDRLLRLDLDEPMDRAVLRSHLETAGGPVTLTEAPAADDYVWCGGRAHEVVIPLAATAPPDPAPCFLTGTTPTPVTRPDATVVYAKLHGQPETFDAVLARVPALLRRWPAPPRWWFARYRHPAPHLRLRIHDPDWRAAGHVAAWAADLRHEGLAADVTFDTYRPETGRYGPRSVMSGAEELFAADSAAVLAQLNCLALARDLHAQALTAASLVDLAAAVMGSHADGVRWLLDHPEHADGARPLDRHLRTQTLRLVEPGMPAGLPGGSALADAWKARAQAAARYTPLLIEETTRLRPCTVLASLLHMHHVRARGIDPQAEAEVYKLARAAALAHAARHPGGDQ